ncbi:MAG TPA: hypothetical protein VIG24_02860 [Acidimicrobiia bacterium]
MGANAQTSVPAFTAGQVLTAAQMTQVNTGIPVFASSTERDAAFGGTGEKTLAEGQMAYLEDTNETQVYDGSVWGAISAGGLVFITSTSVSAASSVSIDGCFTADYDNYLVVMKGTAASSATHEGRIRYRASGVTDTGSVYDNNLIYLTAGAAAAGLRLSTTFEYFSAFSASYPTDGYAYIYRPFVSGVTTGLIGQGAGTAGNSLHINGHNTTSTTAYDGFHVFHGTAGTFSADFYVYGMVTS